MPQDDVQAPEAQPAVVPRASCLEVRVRPVPNGELRLEYEVWGPIGERLDAQVQVLQMVLQSLKQQMAKSRLLIVPGSLVERRK